MSHIVLHLLALGEIEINCIIYGESPTGSRWKIGPKKRMMKPYTDVLTAG